MGYYEAAWEERKGFLVKSVIIGGIIALVTDIMMAASGAFSNGGIMTLVGGFILVFLVFSMVFIPMVAIIRMMRGKAKGFGIGILGGLWTMIVSSIFDFGPGMVLGVLELMLFGVLFMIVALGYSVYLPVSSIYYFVRCKMEKKAAAQ